MDGRHVLSPATRTLLRTVRIADTFQMFVETSRANISLKYGCGSLL
jgi:hypothetical protein